MMIRTTITLPEPLLENAKRRAAEQGVTLSALLEDALRRHLAHEQAKAGRPFRLHTVRGRLVQPDLDLDRTSALITADDEAAFAGSDSKGLFLDESDPNWKVAYPKN